MMQIMAKPASNSINGCFALNNYQQSGIRHCFIEQAQNSPAILDCQYRKDIKIHVAFSRSLWRKAAITMKQAHICGLRNLVRLVNIQVGCVV